MPVLRAKLHPPRITEDIVARDRLLELLADNTDRPVTLVSAPAGYGKSTLVALWLERVEEPTAWLSVDREDQDLRHFLAHFVAAIRSRYRDACPDTFSLLEAVELPAPAVIAGLLSNDLEALSGRLILVLDDFHHADTREVSEILDLLLRHPPRSLHLVLVTRRDPGLSLARLSALGGMGEVRENDLRFNRQETLAVIENVAGVRIGDRALDHLHAELEGWIVGLRLVCLALCDREDPDAYLESLRGGTSSIQDYLTDEVLSRLGTTFQQCLMKTSILNCFTAPLCEAVCAVKVKSLPDATGEEDDPSAPKGGQQFLDRLEKANLFCIGLDPQGDWFRFHHQFQQLLTRQLERRLDGDEIAALHLAASQWFESEGMMDEAVEHAFAAGDVESASGIIERHRRAELDEDRWLRVEQWLHLLPESIRNERPELLLTQAWVCHLRIQTARIPGLVAQLEPLLEAHSDPDPFWIAELKFFRGVILYWEGRGVESKRCFEEGLALIEERRGILGGEMGLFLALARHMCGEGQMAIEAIEQDFRMDDAADFAFSHRMMVAKSFVHLLSGDLVPTARAGARAVSIAERWPSKYAAAWGHYPQALASFHAHELDGAREHFRAVVDRRDFFERRGTVDAYGGLMLTYQLMGRPEDVTRTADELAGFVHDLTDPECLAADASARARLALCQGDLKTAVAWARSVQKEPQALGLLFWQEDPAITLARVLIAEGRDGGLQAAADLLTELRSQAETRHQVCYLIEIMVLQAVALEKLQRPEEVLLVLEECRVIAQPGGWIRPFVEVGASLSDALAELHRGESQESFVGQILAARDQGDSRDKAPVPRAGPNDTLLEPLTNRELDVFELLAERLYDKEIAQRLSISPETVRTHLKHIFGKLGVGDRRQAVERGRQLGLLKPAG